MHVESGIMRTERREVPRTAAVLAVGLASDSKPGRHGVTRDLSPRGLLIVTPSHFVKGERISITVHAGGASAVDVHGRVIRVDENPVSSPELWRWRVGVQLDDTLPSDLIQHGASIASISSGKIRQAAAS
jgi:hypothetical protein